LKVAGRAVGAQRFASSVSISRWMMLRSAAPSCSASVVPQSGLSGPPKNYLNLLSAGLL
jgi:hypothetical protein